MLFYVIIKLVALHLEEPKASFKQKMVDANICIENFQPLSCSAELPHFSAVIFLLRVAPPDGLGKRSGFRFKFRLSYGFEEMNFHSLEEQLGFTYFGFLYSMVLGIGGYVTDQHYRH
ncbi:hypothetical protein AVEN_58531-1 [Araneus ventricosus]|uniref:Uncharacterized protein n=1 Tax=Araneus ventricosus TaxID=182803 RepID=A0A4Y2RVX5_ARAVE|nr:hypothetical protein AVEN_58531-1 [Araneus ventricosus]